MNIHPEDIVKMDYTGAAQLLKPVVYKDGDSFCCLMGPDPQEGVFGCGDTPAQALGDWEVHLQDRLKSGEQDDYIVEYVKDIIANQPVPVYIQEFYDQFRPLSKNKKAPNKRGF